MGFLVQEKKLKIDFQDSGHSSHLGLLIGRILAIFDLQAAQILTCFETVGLSILEKQDKIGF